MFKVGDSIKIIKTKMVNDGILVINDRYIRLWSVYGKVKNQQEDEKGTKSFIVTFDSWKELLDNGDGVYKEATNECGLNIVMSEKGEIFDSDGKVVVWCEKHLPWKEIEEGETYKIKPNSRLCKEVLEWVEYKSKAELKIDPNELTAMVEHTNIAQGLLLAVVVPLVNGKRVTERGWELFENNYSDQLNIDDGIEEL